MIDFNLISRKPSQGHLDCVWIPGDCSLAKLTHKIIRISVSIYWVVIKAELLTVKCNVKNTGEIRESSCPLFGGQMRSDLPPFPWSHPLVFSGLGGTLAGQCYFSCVGCFGFTRGHGVSHVERGELTSRALTPWVAGKPGIRDGSQPGSKNEPHYCQGTKGRICFLGLKVDPKIHLLVRGSGGWSLPNPDMSGNNA